MVPLCIKMQHAKKPLVDQAFKLCDGKYFSMGIKSSVLTGRIRGKMKNWVLPTGLERVLPDHLRF